MSSSPSQSASPSSNGTETPPNTFFGILERLGPGLIIAGSIVGSGELIATTKTGAESGFWLLWLIILGCIIKVFVQVELGRDAVVRGKTTMDALAEVPGPSIPGKGNWLVWYFFLMFFASLAQLGGIVGSVGQAMAISAPLTSFSRLENQRNDIETKLFVNVAEQKIANDKTSSPEIQAQLEELTAEHAKLTAQLAALPALPQTRPWWTDDKIWATILAVVTAVLLVVGRYTLIQNVTTALVAMFTLMTVVTVSMLQTTASWAIRWEDLQNGLSFHLPPAIEGKPSTGVTTALMTFGIIGVGASELISYPYWCLEKGYAKFTGTNDGSQGWADRAKGWMRVMRWDAWCSMFVYTVATIAFYLLGAAVLGRAQLNPSNESLVRTLNVMYEPVFGAWAPLLFLIGAFAVLYSTYFVACAGHARVFSDALRVVGLVKKDQASAEWRVIFFSGMLPLFCLALFFIWPKEPQKLVLISGMMQAIMLPMLAIAALYFRYARCDKRVAPGKAWDFFLILSSVGMLLTAACLIYSQLRKVGLII